MCSVVHASVEAFRRAVTAESDRLTEFCTTWRKFVPGDDCTDGKVLPDDIIGDINVAIGQAELLKKERFTQFNGLIDNCEFGRGEKETTIQDLQGFWDIVYFQIDDIIKKFSGLEKLKQNNWQKEQPKVVKRIIKPPLTKPKVSAPSKPRPAQSSALRAHILAARNKMNQLAVTDEKQVKPTLEAGNVPPQKVLQPPNVPVTKASLEPCTKSTSESNKENIPVITTPQNSPVKPTSMRTPKQKSTTDSTNELSTFDAGFFKVQTPSKSANGVKTASVPVTPNKEAGTVNKVLSSSVLKERIKRTPINHKDYSSCMRITRSMKKINAINLDLDSEQ